MGYFADSDSNGNIIAYYSDEFTYPNGIPSTAIPITDAQWQDSVDNQGKYIVQNGSFVVAPPPTAAQQLSSAKSSKIAELREGYAQTLKGGFQATVGTTSYTFGWTTDDKANLDACQTAVERSYQTFPITYSDLSGNPVTLSSQTDLDSVEQTASKFAFAQHQQILNLIGQVQSATDVTTVNSITWSAATY